MRKLIIIVAACYCVATLHAAQPESTKPATEIQMPLLTPETCLTLIKRLLPPRLPSAIVHSIMQFLPLNNLEEEIQAFTLSEPYMHVSDRFCIPEKNGKDLFLLEVDEKGNIYYAHRDQIFIRQNNAQHAVQPLTLPDGWKFYRPYDGHKHDEQHPITVRKTLDRTSYQLGIYDTQSQSVHLIATCKSSEYPVDVNQKSAIISNCFDTPYYVDDTQKIQVSSRYMAQSLHLNPDCNIVTQKCWDEKGIVQLIRFKNFTTSPQSLWSPITVGVKKYAEAFWQRNNIIAVLSRPYDLPGIHEICCYDLLAPPPSQPFSSIHLPQPTNHTLNTRQIAMDRSASVVLSHNFTLTETSDDFFEDISGGFSIVSLKTGVRLTHSLGSDIEPQYLGSRLSQNGRWIARQYGNEIVTWKVGGFYLDTQLTLEESVAVHELSELYKIGQERNTKYNRQFVIRLTDKHMLHFQKLCKIVNVPEGWARLFRPLKPQQNTCMKNIE